MSSNDSDRSARGKVFVTTPSLLRRMIENFLDDRSFILEHSNVIELCQKFDVCRRAMIQWTIKRAAPAIARCAFDFHRTIFHPITDIKRVN